MLAASADTKLSKTVLAERLGVSRTSLYYQSVKQTKDIALKEQIKAVWSSSPSMASYGHRRLALELGINKKRIRRIMRLFGMKPYRRRTAKPVKLDDLNKAPAEYPNLIKGFCPIQPNVVWAADFTYFWFHDRWLYLATIMDTFTREILGQAISANHNAALVSEALAMALKNQQVWPLFHHSDQGSEYKADEYIGRLKLGHTQISMSEKASPWENGFQESFYAGFKLDLGRPDQFDTIGELTAAIYRTIYVYNKTRIHTKLKQSPSQFRTKYEQRQQIQTPSIIPFPEKLRQLV